jgi:hypothetical protein
LKGKTYNVRTVKGIKNRKRAQIKRRGTFFGKNASNKLKHKGWVIMITNSRPSLKMCFVRNGKRLLKDGKPVPSKNRCYRLKSMANKMIKKFDGKGSGKLPSQTRKINYGFYHK